jgi:hypothetical protein
MLLDQVISLKPLVKRYKNKGKSLMLLSLDTPSPAKLQP